MKLENQVCTRQQGERLKELWVNRSLYHHFKGGIHTEAWGNDYYPAFSVAELGAMLPEFYASYKFYNPDGVKMHKCWNDDADEDEVIQTTEAEARAAMLIYCLENNLTTPDEVNQRLNNS